MTAHKAALLRGFYAPNRQHADLKASYLSLLSPANFSLSLGGLGFFFGETGFGGVFSIRRRTPSSIGDFGMSQPDDPVWGEFERLGVEETRRQAMTDRWGETRKKMALAWVADQESKRSTTLSEAALAEAKAANLLANSTLEEACKANLLATESNSIAKESNLIANASNSFAKEASARASISNRIAIAALITAIIGIIISLYR